MITPGTPWDAMFEDTLTSTSWSQSTGGGTRSRPPKGPGAGGRPPGTSGLVGQTPQTPVYCQLIINPIALLIRLLQK